MPFLTASRRLRQLADTIVLVPADLLVTINTHRFQLFIQTCMIHRGISLIIHTAIRQRLVIKTWFCALGSP